LRTIPSLDNFKAGAQKDKPGDQRRKDPSAARLSALHREIRGFPSPPREGFGVSGYGSNPARHAGGPFYHGGSGNDVQHIKQP